MPHHALVAWLLAASLAPGAAPPRAGETAGPRFEYVHVARVNVHAHGFRPHRGKWFHPVVIGVSAAGEGAVIDWCIGGPLPWGPLPVPPGLFPDTDLADLERCYLERGFLDVRVSREQVSPDAITLYRVQEGQRYTVHKEVRLAGAEPKWWLTVALLPAGQTPEQDARSLRRWAALYGCWVVVTHDWVKSPDQPGTAVLRYMVNFGATARPLIGPSQGPALFP